LIRSLLCAASKFDGEAQKRIMPLMCNARIFSGHLILLVGALLISGCGAGIDRTLEDTVEKTYSVEPTASLSVRNTDGSIRIYGAETNVIKVEAMKNAYRRDRLDQISIEISADAKNVTIETKYPPVAKWGLGDRSGTVDYTIVVPNTCTVAKAELVNGEILIEGMRGESVHASLVNGRLLGHNCFGDLHYAVTSGGLDVAYEWWENVKFSVDAQIKEGNIHAYIPGDASFHLLAQTEDGQIGSEFNDQENRSGEPIDKIDMMVNSNSSAEIKLHAVNGNINIVEANP
jgi:DUF4097 and DUF4098 domain-containing protein YvlB